MTNVLTIINKDGNLLVDSMQVAGVVGKNHADLLRSIKGYVDILGERNFAFTDFFIESTYISDQNKTLPCYLLTKKGCDMVANKMTGKKGVWFTATYITEFERMRESLIAKTTDKGITALLATAEIKRKFELVVDNILQRDNWRGSIKKAIQIMGKDTGNYRELYHDAYLILKNRAGCNLNTRLNNWKLRLIKAKATVTAVNKLKKLDIIEQDKRLKEIFFTVVREMYIKHTASI